jgi:ABC-type nitrate/sulfonate/bicarbonate transport system substrate-binding protein
LGPPTLIDPIELFAASKIDAYLFLPPALIGGGDRNLGHVIASQITDRPWSDYCCMLATRTEFARKYPVATKRVMRAILKGADLCASNPKQIADRLVTQGYTSDMANPALSTGQAAFATRSRSARLPLARLCVLLPLTPPPIIDNFERTPKFAWEENAEWKLDKLQAQIVKHTAGR